jgi:hypothetical protein
MSSEAPKLPFLYVKLRKETITKYTEKVYLDLQSHVSVLRHKICENDNTLNKDNFIMVYCGNVMEDSDLISEHNLFSGATVHLFQKKTIEKPQPPITIDMSHAGLLKLHKAFRSLSFNISLRCLQKGINKNQIINELIMKIPELNKDSIAISLLIHSDLLISIDMDSLKNAVERSPSLALAVLEMSSNNKFVVPVI